MRNSGTAWPITAPAMPVRERCARDPLLRRAPAVSRRISERRRSGGPGSSAGAAAARRFGGGADALGLLEERTAETRLPGDSRAIRAC
jgi:hypothetical protein